MGVTENIDIVSEHASPLANPGSPDAGGQNVHVRELAVALAARGHEVTVWTRRDAPDLPESCRSARGAAAPPRRRPGRPGPRTS